MKQKYAHIEALIERFFDGATSNEEEHELYLFFSGNNLPAHLEEYRHVFAWFENGIAGEIEEKKSILLHPVEEKQKPQKVWMRWTAVAASVLLAAAFYSLHTMQQADFDPFEGSYIIRNGVKITDPDIIRPELEASMQLALLQEMKAEQLFNQLHETGNEFEAVQQQLQQQYCEILNQFTDEVIREEVEKMLDIKCDD